MSIATMQGADATGANIASLPKGVQDAGYVTGSGGVAWTQADWDAHPGAVRIDQTPAGTQWDALADGDDYENGAVTLAELAPRARERLAAYRLGTRPGQRIPFVYASLSNITPVVNALIAGGVQSGVGLWVAHWGLTLAQATSLVATGGGPFPVIAVQYNNAGSHDDDVFSIPWLVTVSTAAPTPAPPPPPVTGRVLVQVESPLLALIDGKTYTVTL